MDLPGVAGCSSFESADWMNIINDNPAPAGCSIRVYWLEGDPLVFLDALENLRPGDVSELYSTVFTGAFRVIEPDSAFSWFDGG